MKERVNAMSKVKDAFVRIRSNRVVKFIGNAFLWLSALFGWVMALILVIGS